MADDRVKKAEAGGSASEGMDAAAGEPGDRDRRGGVGSDWSSWSNLWQAPAIVLSVVLIAAGLFVASHRAPKDDFGAALDEVDEMIAVGRLDAAKQRLQGVIEPNLHKAAPAEQARFHAAVADWVAVSQDAAESHLPENDRIIAEQYAQAVQMGLMMTVGRIERWGGALIALGELEEARKRLAELEALGVTDATGDEARAARNRLLRQLVQLSLAQEDLPYPLMMEVLEEYREDEILSATDRAWAVARQAELRLESGEAQEAADHLLIDMRRLEHAEETLGTSAWAELYTLLGRAYADLGRFDDAGFFIDKALELLKGPEAIRGQALLVLGRIAFAEGDANRAFDLYDEVVQQYVDTSAYLAALFARAEVQSIRGEHEASLEDYRRLMEFLAEPDARRAPRRGIIAESLADRHDAALLVGDLPLALRYVSLAEGLFDAAEVPVHVLFRIASTSRQLADNMIAEALSALEEAGSAPRLAEVSAAVRHAAHVKYEKAGAYYLRHARALAARPGADQTWADSLWLAADSYDLAARRELARQLMREYIAGRPVDDPRRAEVTFRLAQAYQADLEHESAARHYQQVIAEHPRSVYGTASHLPLARCLVAVGRAEEAERQLLDVVEDRFGGRTPLTPEAVDYRAALIELGALYSDRGDYRAAIERLTGAEERYPDDERINEIRYRLADSYRRRARELEDQVEGEATLSPDRRAGLRQMITEHRQRALELFELVCEGYASIDPERLNHFQRDCMRYAWLYRADCAYEMGQYERAVRLYDMAARKYSDHYASMHALVQICNCYSRLGDLQRAEVAHHNALIRLRQLPDAAFAHPEAIMDRAAWEQWLRSRPIGTLAQSKTEEGAAP